MAYNCSQEINCPNASDCKHVHDAADKAVKKVFAILGVDIDKPESVAEFQADLRFSKKLRKTTDHATLAFWAAVATATCAAIWLGIVSKFSGKGG